MTTATPSAAARKWRVGVLDWFITQLEHSPMLSYLVGAVVAVWVELNYGTIVAEWFGLSRPPVLFGSLAVLENFGDLDLSGILGPLMPSLPVDNPWLQSWQALVEVLGTFLGDIPPALLTSAQALGYNLLVYAIPIVIAAVLLRKPAQMLLVRLPAWLGLLIQLGVLYIIIRMWGSLTDYRNLVLMFMGINVILTASLNLVNGYMGEFSVGHGGFMAVGAYISAILTMWLFANDSVFGPALLPGVVALPYGLGTAIGFLLALIVGGLAAALVSLLVAIPSFRTRGDYLAIVTLALNFIVLAAINNINFIGGARGLNGVPLWSTVTWVFVLTVISVLTIRNLVNSTLGKGIIAIREDEIAADLMSVDTRRVKLIAFMYSSFLAGVAGGLFGHVLAYVNPATFGILKSTEALVMVYLGGMGSITGSIVAATLFTILLEALRPLGVLKWVVIPLILILLMIYRPQGLFGGREIKLNLGARKNPEKTAVDYTASQMDKDESDAVITD